MKTKSAIKFEPGNWDLIQEARTQPCEGSKVYSYQAYFGIARLAVLREFPQPSQGF